MARPVRSIRGRRLVRLRRAAQLLSFAMFAGVLWTTTYPLTGPVAPGTLFALDPLLIGTTSLASRTLLVGWTWAAGMLVAAAVLGRFFCGWICPLGASLDLTAWVEPGRRAVVPVSKWRWLKYGVLAALVVAAACGRQFAWVLDPIVITARFVSLNLVPVLVRALDATGAWTIRTFGWYGWPYDAYRALKAGPLSVNTHLFGHAALVLLMFLVVLDLAARSRRLWCRALCPLGAVHALAATRPALRRVVDQCIGCGACLRSCRMGAITAKGASYDPKECVLCMDCVADCPVDRTAFRFGEPPDPAVSVPAVAEPGISRAGFLALCAEAAAATAARTASADIVRALAPGTLSPPALPLRPPGAVPEAELLDRCIRCGDCMKVCVTNGLQPALAEAGWRGLWTPRMVPEVGYCEYGCTLCGQVCPTGAIAPLAPAEKKTFRMGAAVFDRSVCLPWAKDQECFVCEEHCPVPDKAIKLEIVTAGGRRIRRPHADSALCIGCGICTYKCPVRPQRGVVVVAPADHARLIASPRGDLGAGPG